MVLRDPIHGNIKINESIIIELIETFEFQRLRRIKQLGITQLFFPGAEHSRFGHSVGTYYIAKRILDKAEFTDFLSKNEILYFQIAALLHDLGHGPFSHAFEEITGTNHEVLTSAIIAGNTEVNHVLKKSIGESGILEVISIIEKRHANEILNDLLSSDFDIDRMDYLLRDAYYCGVPYGGVNLDRIIDKITIFDGAIAFSEDTIPTLESFLLSRTLMFKQVYRYPASKEVEVTLKDLCAKIVTLSNANYDFKTDIQKLLKILNKDYNYLDFLQLDDVSTVAIFLDLRTEKDEILGQLANDFVSGKNSITNKKPEIIKAKDLVDYSKLINAIKSEDFN